MLKRFERFAYALGEITRCWHKITTDEMEKQGLNGPHALYLTILFQNPNGITAAKLSKLCGKNKSDVSRMISIMEHKGLVKKERSGKNLYRAMLKLTEEGHKAARLVQEKAEAAVLRVSEGLTEEKRAIFYEVLEKITANMQTLSTEGI